MKKLILISLLFKVTVAWATATATPVFSPVGGTFTSPALPPSSHNLNLTSPTPSGVIKWCFTGSSTPCIPATTYSGTITINPPYPNKDQICANAIAPGFTVSPTQCYTWQNAGLATGDGRGVQPEPTFPTNCVQIVQATKFIKSTTTLSLDPWRIGGTCGTGILGCTGAPSLEPSLSNASYINAEGSEDTSLIQTAINSASAGQCVEIVPGTSGQYALIAGPLTRKSGVTVIIDAGIDLDKSNTPTEFGSNCGKVSSSGSFGGSSCATHWIQSAGSGTNSTALIGYGRLNARGWDRFNTNAQCGGLAFCGFTFNSLYTYCNSHGSSKWQGVSCPVFGGNSGISYGPDTLHLKNADSDIMYKFTIVDSANFNIYWGNGSNGLTAWGIKFFAPYNHSNTDGFDPSYNVQNWSLVNSFCSVGDNCVAIKSDSSGPANNGSFLNFQTGDAVGVVYGTEVSGGVGNILVNGLIQRGNSVNGGQQTGFGQTAPSQTSYVGTIINTTFENACMQYTGRAIDFEGPPASQSNTGLNLLNINILSGATSSIKFNGFSAGGLVGILNNVIANGTVSVSAKNTTLTLGPGPVSSNIATNLSGTGVSTSCASGGTAPGSCTYNGATPYPCTTSTFQPLVGELLAKITGNNNAQSINTTAPATFTLQAVIEPTKFPEDNTAGSGELPVLGAIYSPATYPVTFYDSLNSAPKVSVGTGQIMANGTLAQLTLTGVGPGTHVYSASYSDSNYSTFNFGNLTAQINNSGMGTVAGSQFGVVLIGP